MYKLVKILNQWNFIVFQEQKEAVTETVSSSGKSKFKHIHIILRLNPISQWTIYNLNVLVLEEEIIQDAAREQGKLPVCCFIKEVSVRLTWFFSVYEECIQTVQVWDGDSH